MVPASRPGQGAPKFRLRDLLADLACVAALVAIVYGMLLFPEVVR